ncbi:MAG: nitroreductase family protein [Oscillospiraceae bacterium]|nr:nitroreductase family protein [Oscillospiraceae bacterium]
MNNMFSTINTRRSIRKYCSDPVSDEQTEALINAAAAAPSGCNSQCWYFACVKSREMIDGLALATQKGVERFYKDCGDDAFLSSRIRQTTFFRNAPLVICVYKTIMNYHDPRVTRFYEQNGYDHDTMLDMLGSPDILSVGAAIENMLLAAHDMGLGGCWMNDPVVAQAEINEFIGIPEGYRLMSIVPIGKPAYTPRQKVMKPVSEICRII